MPRRDGNARALRGRGISPAAPSTGNALVWNGGLWAPGAGGGSVAPLIIPLGGVMGDSFGTWNTAGSANIDWADYAGLYSTWEYAATVVCSGGGFSTEVQLFDQTNIAVVAALSSPNTTPTALSSSPQPIPAGGTFLYLSQVQIAGASPPSPSDRAVMLSSCIVLKP